jgi:hypothetical protein
MEKIPDKRPKHEKKQQQFTFAIIRSELKKKKSNKSGVRILTCPIKLFALTNLFYLNRIK